MAGEINGPHIYEIAEKFPHQQFEGNMITIAVLKLTRVTSQSVRKPPLSQIAATRCHDYPLTSFTPEKGVLQNCYSTRAPIV
jgi:hypothetical protein